MSKRRQYPRVGNDTATGIRPINVIDKLPSNQLSDEEFVKAFYHRFDARAMLLLYVDVFGQSYIFGRLHRQSSYRAWYWSLVRVMRKALGCKVDSKEIEL